MKEAVRQRARELGFDDCHFTTANPPDHAAEFQNWLAQNQHGEMNYLQRNAHKRVNPQEVLPGAKSIIALAVSYAADVYPCCVVRVKNTTRNTRIHSQPRNTASSPATPASRITTTSSPSA